MDIELFTTDELIEELTRRSSFAGIVIRSTVEPKGGPIVVHQNWDITYSNEFSNSQVADIFEDAVDHFRQLADTEE